MLKIIKQAKRDRERIHEATEAVFDLLETYEGKMYFNPYDTLTSFDLACGFNSVQDKRQPFVTELRDLINRYYRSDTRDAILEGKNG